MEASEATFEGLMETGNDESDQFDTSTITHAMITPDGTTVPITLNPETGQFMTPDGQAVQVQMPNNDETEYMEEVEAVLPDQEVDVNMDHSDASTLQVMASASNQQETPTVVVKEEGSFPIIEQSPVSSGNIQVLSGDGSMV